MEIAEHAIEAEGSIVEPGATWPASLCDAKHCWGVPAGFSPVVAR